MPLLTAIYSIILCVFRSWMGSVCAVALSKAPSCGIFMPDVNKPIVDDTSVTFVLRFVQQSTGRSIDWLSQMHSRKVELQISPRFVLCFV